MALLKVLVEMTTKYATMMEPAQVHIIILNLNTITINGSITNDILRIQGILCILFCFYSFQDATSGETLVMAQLKAHVQILTKYATMMELAQVHIITSTLIQ